MRKVHVCIISCQHGPADPRVIHKKARSFVEEGFEVTWVGPRSENDVVPSSYGIRFLCYPKLSGNHGRIIHNVLSRELAKTVYGVDVYYGLEPDSGGIANSLAKKYGRKSVFTIHEEYHDDMLKNRKLGPFRNFVGDLVRKKVTRVCQEANLVVGVGDIRLNPYRDVSTKKLVVRSAVPVEMGRKNSIDFQIERQTLILMHGKASLAQGTREMLRSLLIAKRKIDVPISSIVFDIYNPREGFDHKEFIKCAESEGVIENIRLLQQMSFIQAMEQLQMCDIGLILYKRTLGVKCMPNRVFEYMSQGLPIIAPRYAVEVSQIVREENCGLLVDAECPEEIAEAIIYIHENKDKKKEMAINSLRAFKERYNWEKQSAPLLDWIRHSMERE